MPDMFVVNGYKGQILSQGFGQSAASEDYILDLFVNNFTVSDTTVVGNLTPGAWTGYNSVSLPRASLLTPTLTGNVAYMGTSATPLWTNSGVSSVSVYGWMLTGATSGKLVAAQNFTGAPIVIPAGNVLPLVPFQIGLESF